jgi:hypothetical protein
MPQFSRSEKATVWGDTTITQPPPELTDEGYVNDTCEGANAIALVPLLYTRFVIQES